MIIRNSPSHLCCKICALKNVVKLTGKQLCQSLIFDEFAAKKYSNICKKTLVQETRCKTCARNTSLIFNKVAGWKHNINLKLLIHLHYFIGLLLTKSKFFVPFR